MKKEFKKSLVKGSSTPNPVPFLEKIPLNGKKKKKKEPGNGGKKHDVYLQGGCRLLEIKSDVLTIVCQYLPIPQVARLASISQRFRQLLHGKGSVKFWFRLANAFTPVEMMAAKDLCRGCGLKSWAEYVKMAHLTKKSPVWNQKRGHSNVVKMTMSDASTSSLSSKFNSESFEAMGVDGEISLVKVLIVGDHGIGKTALAGRFLGGEFTNADYDFKNGMGHAFANYGGGVCVGVFPPSSNFLLISNDLLRASGVMFCFDESSRKSFNALPKYLDFVKAQRPKFEGSAILVGCKKDVGKENINTNEIDLLCRKYGLSYISTSAKTGNNVEKSFRHITLLAMDHQKLVLEQIKRKLDSEEAVKNSLASNTTRIQLLERNLKQVLDEKRAWIKITLAGEIAWEAERRFINEMCGDLVPYESLMYMGLNEFLDWDGKIKKEFKKEYKLGKDVDAKLKKFRKENGLKGGRNFRLLRLVLKALKAMRNDASHSKYEISFKNAFKIAKESINRAYSSSKEYRGKRTKRGHSIQLGQLIGKGRFVCQLGVDNPSDPSREQVLFSGHPQYQPTE